MARGLAAERGWKSAVRIRPDPYAVRTVSKTAVFCGDEVCSPRSPIFAALFLTAEIAGLMHAPNGPRFRLGLSIYKIAEVGKGTGVRFWRMPSQ